MALRMVVGAYAIAVIDKNCPDKIVVARKSSPLVIGIGPIIKSSLLHLMPCRLLNIPNRWFISTTTKWHC